MSDLDEYVRERGITDDEMREARDATKAYVASYRPCQARKATHMTETLAFLDRHVPACEFTHGGAEAALAKVRVGEPVVVMRHGVPAYVIITPDEYRDYEALREEREDAADLALAESRPAAWDGDYSKLKTFEQVMDELGVTEEMADAVPDEEVEFE